MATAGGVRVVSVECALRPSALRVQCMWSVLCACVCVSGLRVVCVGVQVCGEAVGRSSGGVRPGPVRCRGLLPANEAIQRGPERGGEGDRHGEERNLAKQLAEQRDGDRRERVARNGESGQLSGQFKRLGRRGRSDP